MSDNSNAIKEMERINKCCSGASPIYAHNNKRPHDNLECSQDKFNVMAKKIRLEGIPLSLGAVCLATSHCNMHEYTSSHDRQQHPMQWWKTKQPLAVEASSIQCTTLLCCFVCNQRLPSPSEVALYMADQPNKKSSNLLLNYFSARCPTSILSSNTTISAQESRHHFHSSCSFCDRQSCVSCSKICQSCEQRFCTLCTMTDYTCTVERVFCLDCARTTCNRVAMIIE